MDTGAKANVMPFTFLTIYNHELACRKKTYQALTSYGNYKLIPVGKVTLNSTMKTQTHCLSFFVVDIPSFPVLGFQASTQFGLVEKIDSMVEPVGSKKMVLHEYKDVCHKNIELRYDQMQFHLCNLYLGFHPVFMVN